MESQTCPNWLTGYEVCETFIIMSNRQNDLKKVISKENILPTMLSVYWVLSFLQQYNQYYQLMFYNLLH